MFPTPTVDHSGLHYADAQVGNLQSNLSNGLYAFDGSMREVAVYNQALTPNEIETNFLNTVLSSVRNPDLLYYKMANGTETNPAIPFNIPDSSTHGGTHAEYLGGVSTVWTNGPDQPVGAYTAMHFDGGATTGMGGETNGSYIDTTNSTLFSFTTNLFTINLWVRRTQSPDHYIMQNCDAAFYNGWYLYVGDYQVYFSMITNGFGAYHRDAHCRGGEFWSMGHGNDCAKRGYKHHDVYQWSGGSQRRSSKPWPQRFSLKFGVDPDSTNYYDGDIWLPQIWTNALAPIDIANLYINQTSGNPWP